MQNGPIRGVVDITWSLWGQQSVMCSRFSSEYYVIKAPFNGKRVPIWHKTAHPFAYKREPVCQLVAEVRHPARRITSRLRRSPPLGRRPPSSQQKSDRRGETEEKIAALADKSSSSEAWNLLKSWSPLSKPCSQVQVPCVKRPYCFNEEISLMELCELFMLFWSFFF